MSLSETSQEFTCKCEKMTVFVRESVITKPCPECGRFYKGQYNPKTYSIDAVEIGRIKE